jgi:glycosyltransferase involved in cell wall biosynthesis
VITPTHHRHRLLIERCIPSVQAQDYEGMIEQVVVSGPDEELREIARGWPPWLRFHEMDENVADGGATPRRTGCEMAKGDLICYLDDDVAYRPRHVGVLQRALREGADFAYSVMLTWHGAEPANPVGHAPPRHGGIDTSLIMNRAGLLEKATWEKVWTPSDGRITDPDGDLVHRWLALGATWEFCNEVTVDYWHNEAGGSRA